MKRPILIFALAILVAFGCTHFLRSVRATNYTFRPHGYVIGSRGAIEIRKVTTKEGDLSIHCASSDHFNLWGFPSITTRIEVIKHINELPSKRLAVLTLSKEFMTEPEPILSMIAKKEAEWLRSQGFERCLIQGAHGGLGLILLHDTDYEKNPERELKNAHDILEEFPGSIGVDF